MNKTTGRICWRALMVLAGMFMLNSLAWGACTTSRVGHLSYTPPVTLTVPAGAKVGDPIGNVMNTGSGASVNVSCGSSSKTMAMLKFSTPLVATSISNVYETNVPGIGVKVWDDYGQTVYISNDIQKWYSLVSPQGGPAYLTNVKYQYYVTGSITSGSVTLPAPFVDAWMKTGSEVSLNDAVKYFDLTINGSTTIKATTCELDTKDINVPLGDKIITTSLSLAGSTTSPVDFHIQLNCSYVNQLSIKFNADKYTGANNNTIALDSSSTATGVGVQILNNGSPVAVDGTQIVLSKNPIQTTQSLDFPFSARIIRLDAPLTGGEVNATSTFDIIYQ